MGQLCTALTWLLLTQSQHTPCAGVYWSHEYHCAAPFRCTHKEGAAPTFFRFCIVGVLGSMLSQALVWLLVLQLSPLTSYIVFQCLNHIYFWTFTHSWLMDIHTILKSDTEHDAMIMWGLARRVVRRARWCPLCTLYSLPYCQAPLQGIVVVTLSASWWVPVHLFTTISGTLFPTWQTLFKTMIPWFLEVY
jgi:hypothetical protein